MLGPTIYECYDKKPYALTKTATMQNEVCMSKKQRKSSVKNGALRTAQTLRQISNALAYLVVNSTNLKGKKKQDLVPILAELGFGKKVITTVLQATPEAVSERLSEIKAAKKNDKKSNGSLDDAEQPEAIEQTES